MSDRRATIADVAHAAGVSPSTASVVFSGRRPVSDATRRRVKEAAASLGYTGPDPRAASLRSGRSGIVGVVFGESLRDAFVDPAMAAMMDGLADGVAVHGAGLLLLREDPGAGPSLTTTPLDAVVLVGCTPRMRESLAAVQARGIPVVVIEGDAGPQVPRIDLDNREASRQAASHLRSLGHRDVVAVTLPWDVRRRRTWIADDADIQVDVTRERLAGVRDVYPDARAFAASRSSIDEGWEVGRVLLADRRTAPTAIVAQSDLLAAGLLRAAEERGLSVPGDVSIVGFDGVPLDGTAPHVLTTLVQPTVEKGRAAGAAVAAMLAGGDAASLQLTCGFRAGTTTGLAPQPISERDALPSDAPHRMDHTPRAPRA